MQLDIATNAVKKDTYEWKLITHCTRNGIKCCWYMYITSIAHNAHEFATRTIRGGMRVQKREREIGTGTECCSIRIVMLRIEIIEVIRFQWVSHVSMRFVHFQLQLNVIMNVFTAMCNMWGLANSAAPYKGEPQQQQRQNYKHTHTILWQISRRHLRICSHFKFIKWLLFFNYVRLR